MEKRRKVFRWAAYGTALSALAAADVAEGAVVNLTPIPGTVPYGSALQVSFTGGPDLISADIYNVGTSYKLFGTYGKPITGVVAATGAASITSAMPFTFVVYLTGGSVGSTGTHTIGFRVAGGKLGYVRIAMGAGGATPFNIFDAAYETTPGAPIPVPEPPSGAWMALGALALGNAAIRRRKKQREHGRAAVA